MELSFKFPKKGENILGSDLGKGGVRMQREEAPFWTTRINRISGER